MPTFLTLLTLLINAALCQEHSDMPDSLCNNDITSIAQLALSSWSGNFKKDLERIDYDDIFGIGTSVGAVVYPLKPTTFVLSFTPPPNLAESIISLDEYELGIGDGLEGYEPEEGKVWSDILFSATATIGKFTDGTSSTYKSATPSTKWIFSGFSEAGAIASVAALTFLKIRPEADVHVITFASSAPGDSPFAQHVNKRIPCNNAFVRSNLSHFSDEHFLKQCFVGKPQPFTEELETIFAAEIDLTNASVHSTESEDQDPSSAEAPSTDDLTHLSSSKREGSAGRHHAAKRRENP